MPFDHKISKICFVILPGLICAAGIALITQMYPLHINSHTGFGQDPSYQYLFAGVDLLLGNAPIHTDHPGTPLQTFIAGLIATTWLLFRASGLTSFGLFESVLRMPELFLMATSFSLLAITCIALYKLGIQVTRLTRSIPLGLSCQVTPLLYPVVIPNLVFPTPEALLISISTALIAIIAPVVLSTEPISTRRLNSIALWSGILCGVGVAVKITFVPSLALLLLLRQPQLIIKAVIATLAAWFLGVLPILPRLGGMFQWFFNVLTHSGIHGKGGQSVFEWPQLKLAVGWLINHFEIYYLVTLGLIIFLMIACVKTITSLARNSWQLTNEKSDFLSLYVEVPNKTLWTASVFILAMCAQTLMVAKHLGPSYMVPSLVISALAFVWFTQQIRRPSQGSLARQTIEWSWLILVILISTISFKKSLDTISHDHARGLASHHQISREIDKFESPIILGTFNCNFLNCARWFGMSLVPPMEKRMSSVDVNFLYFDIFSKKLHIPGVGELNGEQTAETVKTFITQNRPVLLIAPPYPQLNVLETRLIFSTPVQNLYQVTGMR
jgi:hypothetical protein